MEQIDEHLLKWVCCPYCGSKTRIKLLPTTELKDFPLFCPKCRRTVLVNAADQKIKIAQ